MATTQIIEITEEENQLHRSPHFFKVFFSDIYSFQLVIPPAFEKHIGQEGLGSCSIRGPSGNIWNVNLIKCEDLHFYFSDGWPDFARDHSLETGDFLVFEYHGNRHFSVLILDPTACEKEMAFHVQPSNQPRLTTRKSMRLRAISTSKSLNEGTEIRRNACCMSDNDSLVISTQEIAQQILVSRRRSVTEKVVDRVLERAKRFSSKKPFFIQSLCKSNVCPHFKMRIPTDFASKYLPDDTSKDSVLISPSGKRHTCKILKVRGQARFSSFAWRSFSMENNLDQGDACVFELVNNSKFEIQVHVHRVARKK